MLQDPVERPLVGVGESQEAGLEPVGDLAKKGFRLLASGRRLLASRGRLPGLLLGRDQIQEHRGHQSSGEKVAGDHRKDHGQRERREQEPAHAAQEQDRNQDDAYGKRRHERRSGDLRGPVEDRLPQRRAQVHVAVVVLHLDRGVVDQDSHRQSETAERHHVQAVAQHVEHSERGEDRKRDRGDDDQHAPPRVKEDQDHQADEAGGDSPFVQDPGDRSTNEDALIEQEVHVQALGKTGLDPRHHRSDSAHDRKGRSVAARENWHQDRVPAIAPHQVGLRGVAVVDEAHVADMNHGSVDIADRDVVQVRQDFRAAVDGDVVFDRPHLGRAGGDDDVLFHDGVDHVLGRETPRIERIGIDADVHRAVLAAVGKRNGRASHRHELRPDEAVREVRHLLLGELIAAEAQHDHRHGGRVVLDDQRRRNARREGPKQGLRDGRHLSHRGVHVGARLEVELDHAGPSDRQRLQVLDVVDRRGECPLDDRRDAVLHLFRGEPAVAPDDADHGNVDVREDVRGHGSDGQDPQDGDEEGHDDESVRPPEGESDEPHTSKAFDSSSDRRMPQRRISCHFLSIARAKLGP